MDDDQRNIVPQQVLTNDDKIVSSSQRWQASLKLVFSHKHGRSYLAKRLHYGPLVIQKTLHPEGESVCHGVVVHPPGGVAGGDHLTIDTLVEQGANALLTSPGAGKWYKANGKFAKQQLSFDMAEGGSLEWFPQENILFDGSQVKFDADINLAGNATYAGWEIICFGRQAQKECWLNGAMHQNLRIKRNGKLLWQERAKLTPKHPIMQSIMGMAGNAITANFVVVAGQVPEAILEACRAIKPTFTLDAKAQYGISALPEVFVARYLGQSSQSAKQYFEALWALLRPWYLGRKAVRPRIWNT
jgi:urease accessory protein